MIPPVYFPLKLLLSNIALLKKLLLASRSSLLSSLDCNLIKAQIDNDIINNHYAGKRLDSYLSVVDFRVKPKNRYLPGRYLSWTKGLHHYFRFFHAPYSLINSSSGG